MIQTRTVLHKVRQDVSLQVVHIDEGYVQGQRQTFGERGTDEQGAQEARAAGESDRGDIVLRHTGTLQGRVHYRQDILLMGTTRQLRHYPAVLFVHFLTRDHIAAQDAVHNHRRRRVITTRFNRQYNCRFFHLIPKLAANLQQILHICK